MADDPSKKVTPWRNGYYHSRGHPCMLLFVEGENMIIHPASGKPSNVYDNPKCKGTWTYGDFGEASPDVAKESGKSRYNVKMNTSSYLFPSNLVLSDDGKTLTFYGITRSVDIYEWMNDAEFAKFIASGDPADNMPHQYKEQPENQGKLVWLSGVAGLGKSTSALLLAKKEGYVLYEADSFFFHMNPYVSTDVAEPTLAMFGQHFLTGVPQDRIDCVAEGISSLKDFAEGREYDYEKYSSLYTLMCKDIAREHKRIGGDFAVAQGAPTRKIRDHIRDQLGKNLIFLILCMSKEDQLARIIARHGEEATHIIEPISKVYHLFEPAAEDEANTINVSITTEMTRDDVVEKIICILKDHCN